MRMYQSFLGSFNTHSDLKDRLRVMTDKYTKRKQQVYDPIKYIDTGFYNKQFCKQKSRSSNDLINEINNRCLPNTKNSHSTFRKATLNTIQDEFEKINNIYSN